MIAALVLAGGRSRRMGSDKAALDWDGEPMLARVVRVVSQRCDPVLVVAGETSAAFRGVDDIRDRAAPGIDASKVRWVTDEQEGTGPLGGLVAGLSAAAAAGAEYAFVCATDMPLIAPELIDELRLGVTGSTQAVIARDAQRDHPMAGIYRTDAAGLIADIVAGGERRMLGAIEALTTHRVGISDPDWLVNVNAPEDLHRLRVSAG
ncbi:putative molybdopterin-guanine dinucleotide biosynthesis protein A [Gordonia terrae NBRC 100016]|uniref:Probable molybdenum cofactor guanylyltransferase n=1 Tax=Gordonia terrae NBRC 100016 TaxID=1089454 RepID=A0ABQ0HAF4_9ACTN|nr:putative molybdopterin-guanine dinucleotide biosynthesis protein A [Gordonia terrae NBRC 100016]VTR10105.1 putative molybdenum cofactor guanylyltransferase MobA [Clostridioides difficile]VTS49213.1 molybdopterin-guanine dinucleotide biosynthesis protein A [Gordonia terrae]